MFLSRISIGLMLMSVAGLTTAAESSQAYPTKVIRMVTPGSGGYADIVARLVSPSLSTALGQQVIVDNRPNGFFAPEFVARAPADGYTLLGSGASLWVGPFLRAGAQYDVVKDFAPIIHAVTQPTVLVVSPSLPVKTTKELIALAKARPDELNYASGGTGSTNHLAAELFKSMAGVKIERITYKGNSEAISDLVTGRVQLTFGLSGAVSSHINAKRLRALAVTTSQPSAIFPGVPTVAASGVPGYEAVSQTGVLAPAKTPPEIIRRLNQELVHILTGEDMKQKLFALGSDAVAGSPEAFGATIKSEMARWGKVIRDANIREE